MKKVLFILGNYFPKMSANGVCCHQIMKKYIELGYDVTCISNEQYKTPSFASNDGIKIHYVKIPPAYKIRFYINNEKNKLKAKIYPYLSRLLGYIDFMLSAASFPLVAFSYSRNILKLARKLHKKEKFDIVVGVSYPVDSVYAACKMKEYDRNLVCISYLLDPFAEGRRHKLLKDTTARARLLKKERYVVSVSDAVICQKEHKAHYSTHYSEKEQKKIHYLGVPLLVDNSSCEKKTKPAGPKEVLYAGSLFRDIRSPEFIINVFKLCRDIVLKIYTPADKKWLSELIGDSKNILLHDPVSHDKIIELSKKADAFLNIGNSFSHSAPSKMVEYMSYCKPIISTFRVDNDAGVNLLSDYPAAVSLDERNTSCEDAAKQISELLYSEREEISYTRLKEIFYKETPESFINIVKEYTEI